MMRTRPKSVVEDRYLVKVWQDTWPNMPGLLGANLIFLLWCSPYALLALLDAPALALAVAPFTIGPGIVGLLAYVGKLVRDEPASFWRDSLRGVRSAGAVGCVLAGVTALALTSHGLAFAGAAAADMAGFPFFIWIGQVALLMCLGLLHTHTFTLAALYGNNTWDVMRNAFVLCCAHPTAALAMLSLFALAYALVRAIGWGPMIIAPALVAVFLVNTTVMLVEKHQTS